MNRQDEFDKLFEELEAAPPRLDDTVARAEVRLKAHHRKRLLFTMPAASLAALILVFTMLVNLFPTVAYACGRIPLIGDLARLVAFSPSLSAAVENEYVQPVNREQTANGITARIEYVIVDQTQLNVFYSLTSDAYEYMTMHPELKAAPGDAELDGYILSHGGIGGASGELGYFSVDFVNNVMPDALRLILQVEDAAGPVGTEQAPPEPAAPADTVPPSSKTDEEEFAATFTFDVSFDPYYTEQGELLALDRSFDIDGQTLILSSAEIYPTHSDLNFEAADGNTAWMVGLDYYLENEKGERFEPGANGLLAIGSPDSPMMETQRLESVFFSQSKKLTLYITGVKWLDKDLEKIRVDLANMTAERLPDGVVFESAESGGGGWTVTFSAPQYEPNHSYTLFGSTYYDVNGVMYTQERWITEVYPDGDGPDAMRFTVRFWLLDYPYDVVYLTPCFTRIVTLTEPVAISIK